MNLQSLAKIVMQRLLGAREDVQLAALPSGLPTSIDDNEPLARFLNSTSKFARTNNRVKYSAFVPAKDGMTSVFRHSGKPADELWMIGIQKLNPDEKIFGAGIIKASDCRAIGLEVTSSEPPLRHANIEKWPRRDDPDDERSVRNTLALELASQAELLLRSP